MLTRTSSVFPFTLSLFAGLLLAGAIPSGSNSTPVQGTAANALTYTTKRTASDVLPEFAGGVAVLERPHGVPDQQYEGAWQLDESRRLRTSSGWWHVGLYVVPTTRGKLCQVLAVYSTTTGPHSRGAGGCLTHFSSASPSGAIIFDPDAVDAGGPVIVAGAAPDDVETVDVVVKGVAHRVQIRENAYVYELEDNRSYPESVVITRLGGEVRTLTLHDPRPVMHLCKGGTC